MNLKTGVNIRIRFILWSFFESKYSKDGFYSMKMGLYVYYLLLLL